MTRFLLQALLVGAGLLVAATAPSAQTAYPTKPVRIVVPSSPGDAGDTIARLLADKLSVSLGAQFVVDNRTGAGGRIGTEVAARAEPDGYTLLLGNAGSHAINGALYRSLPFDLVRDFAPITLIASSPNVLVVNAKLAVNSVQDLVALARSKPGTLTFASGGNGTSAHLSMELFKSMAGINLVHVPYKGAAPALLDLVAGEPPLMIVNLPPAMPHITSGALKAVAVTTAARSSRLPQVPTVAEAGLPGFETVAWFGMLAPAGTPPAIVSRLHGAIVEALALPDVRGALERLGAEPIGSTPQAFASLIARDLEKWKKVVAESGATVD